MAAPGEEIMSVGDRSFHITSNLGKGGFSVVKKAYDGDTRKKVALKIMYTDEFQSQRERDVNIAQVHKEIKAMRALNHSHIIRLFGYDLNSTYDNRPCIVLVQELAQSGELFEYLMYTGKFEEPLARYVFQQFMEGLGACHQLGIAHRDLKPENVLLDKHFNVKIADFGFAYPFKRSEDIVNMRTELGTRGYMAPEIAATRDYNHKVDYFASGVILFILIAGFPPFRRTDNSDWWFDKLEKCKYNLFWMAHERKAAFSDDSKALMESMMCCDPANRTDLDGILNSNWLNGQKLTRDQFVATMQDRRRNVLVEKAKQASRDVFTEVISRKLNSPQTGDIISAEDLLTNGIRNEIAGCGSLDQLTEALGGMSINAPDIELALERLPGAVAVEEVSELLGVDEQMAHRIMEDMNATSSGIPWKPFYPGLIEIDQTPLSVFQPALNEAGFVTLKVRIGFGLLSAILTEFMKPSDEENGDKGEVEIDPENSEIDLVFSMEKMEEVPVEDSDEVMEIPIDVNMTINVKLYKCNETNFNKVVFSNPTKNYEAADDFQWIMDEIMKTSVGGARYIPNLQAGMPAFG